jgi:ABC-type sugar transport system permease subunit
MLPLASIIISVGFLRDFSSNRMATLAGEVGQTRQSREPRQTAHSGITAKRGEAILGLLFVAPATIVTIVFGLYPVLLGFFISMQGNKGVLPDGFVGLDQFVRAIGSLAYLIALAVALILVSAGYALFRAAMRRVDHRLNDFAPYLIPAFIAAPFSMLLAVVMFTGSFEYLIPCLIGIGVAIFFYIALRARHPVDNLALSLNSFGMALYLLMATFLVLFTFSEMASYMQPALDVVTTAMAGDRRYGYIFPLDDQFIAFGGLIAGLAAVFAIHTTYRKVPRDIEPGKASFFGALRWLVLFAVIMLGAYLIGAVDAFRATLSELTPEAIQPLTRTRIETVVAQANVWHEVFTISLGILLIVIAYWFWVNAKERETNIGTATFLLASILLVIGGWLFVGELPRAAAAGDEELYRSLLRTVAYAAVCVPAELGLGLLLAYLLFHEVKWGKGFFRTVFFLPYVAPTVATAAVFAMMFTLRPTGVANQILDTFGIPAQQWLRNPDGIFQVVAEIIGGRNTVLPPFLVGPPLPLVSAMIYSIWVFSGYNAVIFLAGLGSVPRDMYEAAQVDGAGHWSTFRHIVFPIISPTTYFLTVLAVIGTFKAFNHIYVLRDEGSRGAMDTTMVYIYETLREGATPQAYTAAISFLLFGIILLMTVIQNRISRDRVFYG